MVYGVYIYAYVCIYMYFSVSTCPKKCAYTYHVYICAYPSRQICMRWCQCLLCKYKEWKCIFPECLYSSDSLPTVALILATKIEHEPCGRSSDRPPGRGQGLPNRQRLRASPRGRGPTHTGKEVTYGLMGGGGGQGNGQNSEIHKITNQKLMIHNNKI